MSQAIPTSKKEFIKSGTLILKMFKIDMVYPQEIKFTLPTIADVLPPLIMDTPLYNEFSLTLREDDWLQLEVLSVDVMDYINQELEAIKLLQQSHGHPGEGYIYFDEIHVRKRASYTKLSLPLAQLIKALPIIEKGNIKFNRQAGFIANGFALRTEGITLYGTVHNGVVNTLGIFVESNANPLLIKKYLL